MRLCDFFGEVSCGDAVGYGGFYRGLGVCEQCGDDFREFCWWFLGGQGW